MNWKKKIPLIMAIVAVFSFVGAILLLVLAVPKADAAYKRVLEVIISCLMIIISLLIAYYLYVIRDAEPNFFLFDRAKKKNIPVENLTFTIVNLAWVFFRAPSLGEAAQLLHAAVSGGFAMPESWLVAGLFGKEIGALQILFPALKRWTDVLRVLVLYGAGMVTILLPKNVPAQMEDFRPRWWQGVGLVVLTAWSILSFTGITTFIYSNF